MLDYGASKVIGLDLSSGMLEKAKTRFKGMNNVELFKHDLRKKLPFESDTATALTACLMLEHLPHDALENVFMEASRVLKPGGYMVVTEMHPWMWERGGAAQFTDPDEGHVVVESHKKTLASYLMAGIRSGLDLVAVKEVPMDQGVAASSGERASKFLSFLMLMIYVLEK